MPVEVDGPVAQGGGLRAVGHDEHRKWLPLSPQGHEQPPLGLEVELGGALVQDQELGSGKKGTRNAEPLPLTARQAQATRAQARRQLLGEGGEQVAETDLAQERTQPVIVGDPGGQAEQQVRPQAVVGDVGVLRHVAQAAAPGDPDLVQRPAVDLDAAGERREQGQERVDQRRLADAGAPDQGQELALADIQVETGEDGPGPGRSRRRDPGR